MALVETFQHTFQVTAFVAIMMIAIEYINILTQGAWPRTLARSRWKQYLTAVVLGGMPGCLGAFAVVALYSHGMVSFGSLVACMVATSGDESFVMFSMFPRKAVFITLGLAAAGLMTGALSDWLFKESTGGVDSSHTFVLHPEEACVCFPGSEIVRQWRNLSLERGVLVIGVGFFTYSLMVGNLGPQNWNWMRWTLLSAGIFAFFIVVTVPEHFLEEHLWNHVALQHIPRILIWTFLALGSVRVLEHFNLMNFINGKTSWAVLLGACFLGIIPESGPHLLFVSLFDRGFIAFSILFASSVVQDGHGMLPVLAHSRQDFVKIKAINLLAGLIIGAIMMSAGL